MNKYSFYIAITAICGTIVYSHARREYPPDTSVCGNDSTMTVRQIDLKKIIVYGKKNDIDLKSPQMSTVSMGQKELLQIPVFFGDADVMKALQTMPGIQTAIDGSAGIYVRGGDYDQNYITLDGSPIYNAEHMRGFVGAIHPDMIQRVNLYKAAFPARYGSRLSSVIDFGLKPGDFEHYHGNVSFDAMAGRIQLEGPLWKNHTSFNLGGRISYFNLIARPVLKKVYDQPDALQPYNKMKYADVTGKITHRINDSHSLTVVAYWGTDKDEDQPESSTIISNTLDDPDYFIKDRCKYTETKESSTCSDWTNLLGSLYWTAHWNKKLHSNVNVSYSKYNKTITNESMLENEMLDLYRNTSDRPFGYTYSHSTVTYTSKIQDIALTSDLTYRLSDNSTIRSGAKLSIQLMNPHTNIERYLYSKKFNFEMNSNDTGIELNPEYLEHTATISNHPDQTIHIQTGSIYAEDEIRLTSALCSNIGIRLNAYHADKKTSLSLEPRWSTSYLLSDHLSIKASYARMSQAIHRLSSNSLVMSNEIWVPVTRSIPVMKSNNYAAGICWDISPSLSATIETYYKDMNHLLDYKDGSSYTQGTGNWKDLVATGKGKSYGWEILLEKKCGKNTGWISYTWSRSLRTFNKEGQLINAGNPYYANADRRHHLTVNMSREIPVTPYSHFNISATWTYQSGRRGTLPTSTYFAGQLDESNPLKKYYGTYSAQTWTSHIENILHTLWNQDRLITPVTTYDGRNNYLLPAIHHLDINFSFSFHNKWGTSSIALDFYNIYNRMNISSIYLGYRNDKYVLKGLCPFPFMPSVVLSHKF